MTDVLVRRGQYGSPLPLVGGSDGAGVDVATGEEVVVLPSLWWGDGQLLKEEAAVASWPSPPPRLRGRKTATSPAARSGRSPPRRWRCMSAA